MKKIILLIIILCIPAFAKSYDSPTEGVLTHKFVGEKDMKSDLMRMLINFTPYMENLWLGIDNKSSDGLTLGTFKGENTLGNNEQGVRHNADFSMICAFLSKYAPDSLLTSDHRKKLSEMAEYSLNYSLSTHKANRTYPCKNNNFWGSVSKDDSQWESSLWAMSVAYSAFFQWDKLTQAQKNALLRMLEAECDYELQRDIPTGFLGDTKAEENGWEADVLASALGLFPNHPKADKWFNRLREFAINSYSHPSDATNQTVIDPDYDSVTVADLYKGANLFSDWTLQNHHLFHTSYQNVVMQELGEAALAMKLFQTGIYGKEKWKTNALMHNNRKVMQKVLNRLALADGELAMPNGNDWSLFLFDQITSYSTLACIDRDTEALLLENLAYKNIKARQTTTTDGSWLLRPDVGARRMGVEAHRVMMTWLLHHIYSTEELEPIEWEEFRKIYGDTYIFPDQNIIRTSSPARFVCFSWSPGLKSYTGYLTSNKPDKNKIIVPFRAHNTGNFLGWREVKARNTNAAPIVSGKYNYDEKQFVMNGSLLTNDSTIELRFTIWATPGNAVICLDGSKALENIHIEQEKGGLTAISIDPFTNISRTFFTSDNYAGLKLTGDSLVEFNSSWLNIDNELGFITPGKSAMAFGDKRNNNSILTSLLYTHYSDAPVDVMRDEEFGFRSTVYLTSVNISETEEIAAATRSLTSHLSTGWDGIYTIDPDKTGYILISNFFGKERGMLRNLNFGRWIPVLPEITRISSGRIATPILLPAGDSKAWIIDKFIEGNNISVNSESADPDKIKIVNHNNNSTEIKIKVIKGQDERVGIYTLKRGETRLIDTSSISKH